MENCDMSVISDTSKSSPTGDPTSEASIVASAEQNMLEEKKRRRRELNRIYSRRSVLKKKTMMENLENEAKMLEECMARLELQEAFYQNEKQMMKVVEQGLHQEIDHFEKERMLRNAQDEKNMAEAIKMKQLQAKKHAQVDAWLLN